MAWPAFSEGSQICFWTLVPLEPFWRIARLGIVTSECHCCLHFLWGPCGKGGLPLGKEGVFSLLKMEPRHLDSLMSQLLVGHRPNRHALFRAHATGCASCPSSHHWHHRISIWPGKHHLPVCLSPRQHPLRICLFRGQVSSLRCVVPKFLLDWDSFWGLMLHNRGTSGLFLLERNLLMQSHRYALLWPYNYWYIFSNVE